MAVYSKFQTIDTSCMEYMHPWATSCTDASAIMFIESLYTSFRIYLTAYLLTVLMRGKIPNKKDIKYTILGIAQSTFFLSCHAFGFPAAVCLLRRLFGNFSFMTVAFVPAFISSLFSLMVERPSRRNLLSLYVTNVASETLFWMAVSRKWVKPVRYGEVLIFSLSTTILLYLFRSVHDEKDSVYSLLRFFVGQYEEFGNNQSIRSPIVRRSEGSHPLCPHPDSCTHYTLKSSVRLFSIGCGLQVCVKLLLQFSRMWKKPKLIFSNVFQLDTIRLGALFAGFGGLFRAVSCALRHHQNQDSELHAIPAGLVAGLAFFFFREKTVSLYAMWKAIQILYNKGVEKGKLPSIPGGTIFVYALATATLFHAALLEPHNLRPSYWKFLVNLSANRIILMDRNCLDVFGLESSKSLRLAQEKLLKH